MTILYSVIMRKGERLVECYAAGEPVGTTVYAPIVTLLAERIDYETVIQKSYMHQGYSFNYMVNEEGLCFMAVAKADFQTRICFAFLARISQEYNVGSRYKATMAQHMDYFSNNSGADKIRNIQSEVDKVKVVMQKNIDDILARGEKIDKLVEDTEKLEQSASTFKSSSAELKRALWCRNIKLTVAIIVILAAVIFFVIVGICGGFQFPKCGGSDGSTTTTATTAATTSPRRSDAFAQTGALVRMLPR